MGKEFRGKPCSDLAPDSSFSLQTLALSRPGVQSCMEIVWEHIRAIAAEEVDQTLASLPEPLKQRALTLPVTLQPAPNEAQMADGIEEDTLGLFVGPDYADQEVTSFPIPPQIILFLRNLWEMVEGREDEFRLEVRTTLLHELGHYLGLDEDEITFRGLQ